jgi:hypothetical protein
MLGLLEGESWATDEHQPLAEGKIRNDTVVFRQLLEGESWATDEHYRSRCGKISPLLEGESWATDEHGGNSSVPSLEQTAFRR